MTCLCSFVHFFELAEGELSFVHLYHTLLLILWLTHFLHLKGKRTILILTDVGDNDVWILLEVVINHFVALYLGLMEALSLFIIFVHGLQGIKNKM